MAVEWPSNRSRIVVVTTACNTNDMRRLLVAYTLIHSSLSFYIFAILAMHLLFAYVCFLKSRSVALIIHRDRPYERRAQLGTFFGRVSQAHSQGLWIHGDINGLFSIPFKKGHVS